MNENHLLNAVLEATHEAIIVVNSEGVVVKCNQKLQEIIGLAAEDFVGFPIETMLPGLDSDKEISNYEIRHLKKDFIVRNSTVISDQSFYKIFFVSDNHFNIELGNKYAEMKVLKDIYESILNSVDEGIHVADAGGKVRFINPSQKKLDGLTDDVIGKHWMEIYDVDENTSLVLRALNEGKPFLDVYQNYVTQDGKYVSIVCSSVPLYSEGKLIGAAAITKDFVKFQEIAEKILHFQGKSGSGSKAKNKKNESSYSFQQILGKNALLQDSVKWGRAGAQSESSVLIYGETGTGKEMFAQSIHRESSRSGGPFLAINCAAIPENLLEGILFGTTKGAFTGAVDRMGLIEQAGGGTLFLDEINSMPILLQSKLLRVVEEKRIMRLGGKEELSVDVRIISSCNVEPSEAIEKGQLRHDLFYRLAVIYIYIPPLRERLDDIDILVRDFIDKYNAQMGKKVKNVSDDVLEMFHRYNWPGNVRQLMHCIECAMNLTQCGETLIKREHVPKYLLLNYQQNNNAAAILNRSGYGGEAAAGSNILEEIQNHEKQEIIIALKKSRGNVARAAASLGMSRQRLHYRLRKYEII